MDLYYNFQHALGSVAASELMSQAAWNLCPVAGAPHGSDCYYSNDQTFTSLSGEVHIIFTDIPDGVPRAKRATCWPPVWFVHWN